MLVRFGMCRHEIEGQPYRIRTVGCGHIFHEAMPDTVINPIGNVMQAGRVTVNFTVTVTDVLQVSRIVGLIYRPVLDGGQ